MPSGFPPPIDLTSLPGFARTDVRTPHITVFLGRVSTKDNQDPCSSIPGQAATCRPRLDDGEAFAGHYWDVESGYLGLDKRSLGDEAFYRQLGVPLPRDGGLTELLEAARAGHITRVLCERSDRCARDMLAVLTVEDLLAEAGAELVYANEPTIESSRGRLSSGHLRMRRGGQVEAEVFKVTMGEMSERGQIQHAVQGYNHGTPPYPYITRIDPDAPVRADRFLRRPKRRLALHPDPRRFDTMVEMSRLRRAERAADAEIVNLFASDPGAHPIDTQWTHQRVAGLLANPKLTGHQVWGRKTARGTRLRPIEEWIWSPHPTHPAVLTIEEWAEAQTITAQMRASRRDGMARVRDAASAQGMGVQVIRSNDRHVVYGVGPHQFVVRRGALDDATAEQVISHLRAAA
ncbi:resolvase-like protein [Murinocardiopsis flavida]|uniref:Resolvase-like protein n=1 Tax=Murinocardiopsis flavida TaxID=645275 RepID=A0A2P8CUT5_9ACTN|nr:recombinase family protein [Murinocardiopsis flavida]PSK88718.1 resolvase-like protein [Murinocardiopsis flavida]